MSLDQLINVVKLAAIAAHDANVEAERARLASDDAEAMSREAGEALRNAEFALVSYIRTEAVSA